MIRQHLRFRYGVLLAYLLALATAHILARSLDLPALSQLSVSVLFCVVVQTIYGREWLSW